MFSRDQMGDAPIGEICCAGTQDWDQPWKKTHIRNTPARTPRGSDGIQARLNAERNHDTSMDFNVMPDRIPQSGEILTKNATQTKSGSMRCCLFGQMHAPM